MDDTTSPEPTQPDQPDQPEDEVYSADEEQLVAERLEALGYIG